MRRNTLRSSFHAAACALVAVLAAAPLRAQDDLAAQIERYAAPLAEAGWLSGTLLVARGDEALIERSWGMADVEHGVPNTPATVFNIASVTKPMTIAVAAQLIDEGKLRAEDLLSAWIPDFPRGDEITIQHLLSHRSGIPHRVTTAAQEREPRTAAGMVQLAKRAELVFEPGTSRLYSSAGFSVLARVLELAGGKPFPELLEERVFAPAGMGHTADVGAGAILPGRAAAYAWGPRGKRNAPLQDLSFLVGAGSVWSTPRDLYLLQRALYAEKLGEPALEALRRPWGLRWNGATSGFRAYADYQSATDTHMVFAANVPTGAADLLRTAVPRILAGVPVAPPELPAYEPADVDLEVLRGYEGLYELRAGRPMDVRAVEGCLYVEGWALLPTSATSFFSPQDFGEVTVVLDEAGRPLRMDWVTGGETSPMRRVGDRRPEEP